MILKSKGKAEKTKSVLSQEFKKEKFSRKSIDKEFFTRNRQRLLKKMIPDSLAILGGNYPLYTNGDGVLPYVPNYDLWYFTGIDQDQTILLLIKTRKNFEQILFILPRDPKIEVWDGKRFSPEEARKISGIEKILTTQDWEETLKKNAHLISTIYINLQEHARAPSYRNRNHDLHDHCRKEFPLHQYERLAPLIYLLRMVKSSEEIAEIRVATSISREALERVLPLIVAGNKEKDLEAEMMAVYTRHGGAAFSPIIASGGNSCTLHYISNHSILTERDILLIDSGARGGSSQKYPADITRVFPIRKRRNSLPEFSSRQRQVYEAVLRILSETMTLVKPGLRFREYQKKFAMLLKHELLELNLLKKKEMSDPNASLKYCMHGVSHWLGLDVHDVGGYEGEFKEGMVLTCEPGIYIPEEKIGIRLENNLWIKSSQETENLSQEIPVEIEAVCQWMDHSLP